MSCQTKLIENLHYQPVLIPFTSHNSKLNQIMLLLDFTVFLWWPFPERARSRPFLNAFHNTTAIISLHKIWDICSQCNNVVNINCLKVHKILELVQFIHCQWGHIQACPSAKQNVNLEPFPRKRDTKWVICIHKKKRRHMEKSFTKLTIPSA